MLFMRLFFYPDEDCRFRCLVRNLWFALLLSLTVLSVVYPDPLSRLDILSYFVPLVIYWTPLFQSRSNLDSVPEWAKWILFGVLFVPIIGVSLLLITVIGLATMKYREGSDYGESSSARETGSDDQLENSDGEDESSKPGVSEKSSSISESNDLLNRLKEKLEKRGYNQDIVSEVFEDLNDSGLDDSQVKTALHLTANNVGIRRVLLSLESDAVSEDKIDALIREADEVKSGMRDRFAISDIENHSRKSRTEEGSSSSDEKDRESDNLCESQKDAERVMSGDQKSIDESSASMSEERQYFTPEFNQISYHHNRNLQVITDDESDRESADENEKKKLLNRLKRRLKNEKYDQDIISEVFKALEAKNLERRQIKNALSLLANRVQLKRILFCLESEDLSEQKINSIINKELKKAASGDQEQPEDYNVEYFSEPPENIGKSSSSDDRINDSGSDDQDTKDTEQEKTSEDDDLLKITLTDLPNISFASIEGEGSSYEYSLSPSSEYILCYQDGHRDATGEKENWVGGEVILLKVAETVSEDILTGRHVTKFDFDRPLNADINDRGEWLVVNSNSNEDKDSVKWFNEKNLEAKSEFDVNIMNSEISNEGISVLVTAPAYSTVYCFRNGVKEWEKKISDKMPFRIMDIEFIPEEEEVRVESHDGNSGFTMSYTGEIIDDSVINEDKNRSVNNYDGDLPEDSGSFPKKSYLSSLKFSNEEKEEIRDRFRENKEKIIRKEEKLDYVGTKNSSYRSSFLVRRNDEILPLEKSVKQYYENKGWWISRSLRENGNSVVNIFSGNSSVDIPEDETLDESVHSFLKTHSRGLPDLFGYDPSEDQFYFIEIKSQNDTLSLVQKKWYNEFLELEPEIEYMLQSVGAKTIRPRTLESVPLKGISHRGIPLSYFNSISKNETVELEPEPDNQHDPLAVKVIHDEKFIGYLPQNMHYKEKVIEAIKEGDYNAKITHFHRADNKEEYGAFMKIDFLRSE